MPRSWFLVSFSNERNQPEEMADPRAGAGNIRDEPIASCSPRKFEGALKILKNTIYVNGTQEPTENAPKGQC